MAALVTATLLVLYLPTLKVLGATSWSTVEQSYGPVLLAASAWLFWQRREQLAELPAPAGSAAGFAWLLAALAVYVLGRSQGVLVLEAASVVPLCTALVLLYRGWAGVKASLLPLVLLLFIAPIPSDIVAAMTGPLKSAVSAVAASLLASAGYPVARTGVILMVGPYQLLVADACAGLTSMFTLEAIGLVYMGLRNHPSTARNVALGLLLVPIAFVANVIRVLVLVLVTYHFGDEAGQGFVHGAAGILLFMVATGLMLATDAMLGLYRWKPGGVRQAPASP